MKVETLRLEKQLSLVHYVDEVATWASRGRSVFRTDRATDAWKPVAEFPFSVPKDYANMHRWTSRLLRGEKCNVYPTREGKLLGIRRGAVYDLSQGGGEGAPVLAKISGDCVMPRALAEDQEGRIYFGEYFGNPDRGPVRIWRADPDLGRCEVVYSFEPGKTRHIHAVHADPFVPGRLWVTMGDFAGECHLVYTDDCFENVSFLGEANQLWRMVGVIFQEERLCWLTDTHIEQNYVVSMSRTTTRAEVHAKRDASSWYAAETTDGLYLATTTVEPGEGIQTDRVRLLASEDGTEWEQIIEWKKDSLPMAGFGFGSISLPSGRFGSDGVWVSGAGIRELDGASELLRLRK